VAIPPADISLPSLSHRYWLVAAGSFMVRSVDCMVAGSLEAPAGGWMH